MRVFPEFFYNMADDKGNIVKDEKGEPIIIELNGSQPGVIGEQLVAGPIFGNRTQEVIDYCKSKKFSY